MPLPPTAEVDWNVASVVKPFSLFQRAQYDPNTGLVELGWDAPSNVNITCFRHYKSTDGHTWPTPGICSTPLGSIGDGAWYKSAPGDRAVNDINHGTLPFYYRIIGFMDNGLQIPYNDLIIFQKDTVPPTCQILTPANGATLVGPFQIQVACQDNISLNHVDIIVQDRGSNLVVASLPLAGTSQTVSYTLDPTLRPFTNGGHLILASTFDNATPPNRGNSNDLGVLTQVVFNNAQTEVGNLQYALDAGHSIDTGPPKSVVSFNCNAVDSTGDNVVAGTYLNHVTLFGAPFNSVSNIISDGFIAKTDTSGVLKWINPVPGGTCVFSSVITDSSNNVYATGNFKGTINLGGSDLTSTGAGPDSFLVKYDSNGNHLFSIRFGGSNGTLSKSIGFHSGKLYVGGDFKYQCNFGGGVRTGNSSGQPTGFVAQYNASDLSYVWDTFFTGGNHNTEQAMCVDSSGNAYITGYIQNDQSNTEDFGGGPIPYPVGANNAGFVAAFGPTGTYLWARMFGGSGGITSGNTIAFGASGLWLTGGFTAPFTLDSITFNPISASSYMFITRLNVNNGVAIQGYGIGAEASSNGATISSISSVVDPNGFLIICGTVAHDNDFGDNIVTSGSSAAFIAKYTTNSSHVIMWWTRDASNAGGATGTIYNSVAISPVDRSLSLVGNYGGAITIHGGNLLGFQIGTGSTSITSISIQVQDGMLVKYSA